ncbi:unnamed protein product [[Candida] boidinii]|uniref:Unnamed protein product n=1 Tax=Candida boidinii TaxID=5477 RepID=A0ACB5TXZ0_CANBO|nr:unnamed protein product [[Candida] boidinii]
MIIVEVNRDSFLSYFEVYNHLIEIQEENGWDFKKDDKTAGNNNKKDRKNDKFKNKRNNNLIDLEIITKDLNSYLSKIGSIPIRLPDFNNNRFDPEIRRKKKLERIKKYKKKQQRLENGEDNVEEEDDDEEEEEEELIIPGRQNFIDSMIELNKFSLEKIEKLQIVNFKPRSIVLLYSIVEECDQRFNEDECNSIIEIVNTYFPVLDVPEEEGAGEGEGQINTEEIEEQQPVEEDYYEEEFEDDGNDLEHESTRSAPKPEGMDIDEE